MLPFLDVPGYIPFPALGLDDDDAAGAWVSPPSAAAVVSPDPDAAVVSVCAAVVVSDGASDLPPHAASDNTITDAIANDKILFFPTQQIHESLKVSVLSFSKCSLSLMP